MISDLMLSKKSCQKFISRKKIDAALHMFANITEYFIYMYTLQLIVGFGYQINTIPRQQKKLKRQMPKHFCKKITGVMKVTSALCSTQGATISNYRKLINYST